MKKLIVILCAAVLILGCEDTKQKTADSDLYKRMESAGTKWSDYGALSSGNIADGDDFLIRDVSDTTLGATGTQKRYAWSTFKVDAKTYNDTLYQPLAAILTDLADGTIATNMVNMAYPWADNEVADNLTVQGGSVNNDSFSAYSDLGAESKIGTGAAQVAAGDHTHSGYESSTSNDIDPDRLAGDTVDDNYIDNGLIHWAAPAAIGGSTPAAATFTTLGAGAAGFAVDADGDTTVKSLTITKSSGVAGDLGLYEANSTDTHGAGFRGPASITGDGAYRGQFPNARPTSPNMVMAWTNAAESGTGTAIDPYIQATSWLDLDDYQAASATLTSLAGLTETAGGIPYGTGDNAYAWLAAGSVSQILVGGGATAPVWTSATGTGAPVRAASPTLTGTITTGYLTPATAGASTVGTNALPYSGIYLGNAATNNIQLTGTSTTYKTATFPDVTGYVAVASMSAVSTQPLFATGTAGAPAYRNIAAGDLPGGIASLAGLTETNGGIPYGTVDNGYAWLAAGAAGKHLQGAGAAAPTWTTSTYADTYSIGTILHASAANTVTGLAAGAAGTVLQGAGAAAPAFSTATYPATIGIGEILYGSASNVISGLAAGATTTILVGGGAAAPVWTTATGSGSPVRATNPTLVTPVLGAATGTSLALTGNLTGLTPSIVLTHASGVHDGSDNQAIMTDSGEAFTVNGMVGMTVYNVTDASSCTITANAATTITCTLAGGSENDWDTNDVWQVGPGPSQSGSIFYVGLASTIRHPNTVGYTAMYYATTTGVVTVEVDAAMVITAATAAAIDAGDTIDSGGTADEFVVLHNQSAIKANAMGRRGTWVDGGAT